MLQIKEFSKDNNNRYINNDYSLFHNAIRYVKCGETRFHVKNQNAEDFDLVYVDNDAYVKSNVDFPQSDFFLKEMLIPPYYEYEENDTDSLFMDLFQGYDEIFFEELCEYTIVIARILLEHADIKITFKDEGIKLFPDIWSRVSVSDKPMEYDCIYVQENFIPEFNQMNRICTLELFHSVFLLQWMMSLSNGEIKYLEVVIKKTEGIGSIISTYKRIEEAFKSKNVNTFLSPGCTRYSDELLNEYFAITTKTEDAVEDNTAIVYQFNAITLNHTVQQYNPDIDKSMFSKRFLQDLNEYADAVLGTKKILGILYRGTDYILANFSGSYSPVSIEATIDAARERIVTEHYDKIFLATEDSDALSRMVEAFPGKILAISQVRHSVKDFKGLKYISELEKAEKNGKDYEAYIEDNTVNYCYALFMLSRCDAFLSNCMCSGVNIVKSFNENQFTEVKILSETEN